MAPSTSPTPPETDQNVFECFYFYSSTCFVINTKTTFSFFQFKSNRLIYSDLFFMFPVWKESSFDEEERSSGHDCLFVPQSCSKTTLASL